jgi:hypothetical protein
MAESRRDTSPFTTDTPALSPMWNRRGQRSEVKIDPDPYLYYGKDE